MGVRKSEAFSKIHRILHAPKSKILKALDFDLGTCWIRALEEYKIRDIFRWDENMYPVALLPVGYPDEDPAPKKRLKIEDIIID